MFNATQPTQDRIGEGPYRFRVTFRCEAPALGKVFFNTELHRREDEYRLRALALNWTVEAVHVLDGDCGCAKRADLSPTCSCATGWDNHSQ